MTVEYVKCSNLDTSSHVRLLTEQERANFYKDKFHVEKELKFYLVKSNQFDPTNFDVKKRTDRSSVSSDKGAEKNEK